jgi:YEATS domain-containing protein 4
VTETGWGEFDIVVKIFFTQEAAEKPLTFTHHLKLHPWPVDLSKVPVPGSESAIAAAAAASSAASGTGSSGAATQTPESPKLVLSPVHSWQYEEVVFVEPTETFYTILLTNPPTPLPPRNRHPKTLVHALGGGGNFGEFSLEMEKEEGERMEAARRKVLKEMEELRQSLASHEKDLQGQ